MNRREFLWSTTALATVALLPPAEARLDAADGDFDYGPPDPPEEGECLCYGCVTMRHRCRYES